MSDIEKVDASDEAVTRRDALRLGGAVAALAAGLGVVLDASAAPADAAEQAQMLQMKYAPQGAPAQMQLKLYRLDAKANPASAELLYTVAIPAAVAQKLSDTTGATLEQKLFMADGSAPGGSRLVQDSIVQWKCLQIKGELGQLQIKDTNPGMIQLKPGPGQLQQKK